MPKSCLLIVFAFAAGCAGKPHVDSAEVQPTAESHGVSVIRNGYASGAESDHVVVTRQKPDKEPTPAREPPIILPHYYEEEPIFRQW